MNGIPYFPAKKSSGRSFNILKTMMLLFAFVREDKLFPQKKPLHEKTLMALGNSVFE